jgi:hypothetical protein
MVAQRGMCRLERKIPSDGACRFASILVSAVALWAACCGTALLTIMCLSLDLLLYH